MDIVLASSNHGKIKEFQQIFDSLNLSVIPQDILGIDSAEETGQTFMENALTKARHASALASLPAIADDSGLEVDCLNGAPGVMSARFAGENSSDEENNQYLLELLKNIPIEKRTARYHCTIVYLEKPVQSNPIICQGSWEGIIADAGFGSGGFGYDPLFIVKDFGLRASELRPAEKNKISHRGQAMAKLMDALSARGVRPE